MPKSDSYLGGSTMVRMGSSWFSRPQLKVDPESGETREERIKRLATEARRRKELKVAQSQKAKKHSSLNAPKERFQRNEQRRLEKAEKNRAKLAAKEADTPSVPRQSDLQQEERISKVSIERRRRRKT